MARGYTDLDRARVKTILEVNEGNVKRTSRETGVAEQTVRDWKKKWEREGVPEEVEAALPAVQQEFTDDAKRVRNKALLALERAIDAGEVKGRDLTVAVGVLTDKVRAIEGSSKPPSETGGAIPVEQVRDLFRGLAAGIVDAAQQRAATISSAVDDDVIDGESVEQAELLALPAPSSE